MCLYLHLQDTDILVFADAGFYTGVSTNDGSVLWRIADPLQGEFTSRPAALRSGLFAGTIFTSEGGNYQKNAGAAAFSGSFVLIWSFL